MPRAIAWLQGKLGRRGAFLLLMGFVWLFIGASVATDNNFNIDDAILDQLLFPKEVIGAAWAVSGVLAMLCALRGAREKYGFMILIVMPMIRVVSNIFGFAHYVIPGPPPGSLTAFWNIFVWGSIGLVIYIVAGWREDTVRSLG